MLSFKRLSSVAALLTVGIAVGLIIPAAGCTGGYGVNEVLRQLVEIRGLDTGETTVTIRISNQTAGYEEQLTIRIDGVTDVLTCSADEMVCDFVLTEIPDLIEALEEQRYDEDGGFGGGWILEGQPEFTLDQNDYRPGSIILFQLGVEAAEVRVL